MRVVVAGARVAGAASALALFKRGADVTVIDRNDSPALQELAGAGIKVVVGDTMSLSGVDELVVSPGFAPHHPLVVAALAQGIDVYSEPELAWRLRGPDAPIWLGITGTNGKTTTTTMLASILRAGGLRTEALGNIGVPLVEAQTGYDVLAVELSSFQLHWSSTLAPQAGAILNLADDHLDWHGSFEHYAAAKTAVWRGASTSVGNLDDPGVCTLLGDAPGQQVGFTLGIPPRGCLGVVEDLLVHRPLDGDAHELTEVVEIKPAGPHNVANALAAAALALSVGVSYADIRKGLVEYVPEPHRNAFVASVDGVSYVDDSKATNPHAALASLMSYDRVIWVAGGQLKGVDIDELVAMVAPRLGGAVLLGVDRAQIASALRKHAPELPIVEIGRTEPDAMSDAVRAAAKLAHPGDTVLLAPAAASLDMYSSYAARGKAFSAAVASL